MLPSANQSVMLMRTTRLAIQELACNVHGSGDVILSNHVPAGIEREFLAWALAKAGNARYRVRQNWTRA
jgi:hypothetical protein